MNLRHLELFSTSIIVLFFFGGCGAGSVSDPKDGQCSAAHCQEQGKNCGEILVEGCTPISCGTCQDGQTCGGGGTPNVCALGNCTPTTCQAQELDCGMISDGCTGVLDCGQCTTLNVEHCLAGKCVECVTDEHCGNPDFACQDNVCVQLDDCNTNEYFMALEQWDMYESSFTTANAYSNPWLEVTFGATFTHTETATTLTVPGFYDGDGTGGETGNVWKLRFMPDRIGTWTFLTSSNDPQLNGRPGCLLATPPTGNNHGPVAQHPTKPNRYSHADGTGFVLMGDHENYQWFMAHLLDGQAQTQADYEKQYHLNVRTTCSHSKHGSPEYGRAFFNATAVDYSRMHMRFWKNLDDLMKFNLKNGIYTVNSFLGWNEDEQYLHEDVFEEYFTYGIARLWAYRNLVTYNLGGEVDEHQDQSWAEKWMKFINAADPLKRKTVVHKTNYWTWYGAADESWWMGVWAQLWKTPDELNAEVLNIRSQTTKPVWIEEYNIIGFNGDGTSARQKSWAIYLAGGFGTPASYAASTPKNSDWLPYLGIMLDILETTSYPDMSPRNDLLTGGGTGKYCMANPGRDYVVYSAGGSASVEIDLTVAAGELAVKWHNPVDGKQQTGANVRGGNKVTLTSPYGTAEAVLVLKATSGYAFTFGPEILVGAGERPGIAMAPNGDIHVVYVRSNSVRYRKYANGTLSPEETVYSGQSWWPHIAVSQDNDVHVVWERTVIDEGNGYVGYSRRVSATWKATGNLHTIPYRAMIPRVDVDPGNRAHVVFWKNMGSGDDTVARGQYNRIGLLNGAPNIELSIDIPGWEGNRQGDVIVDGDRVVHIFNAHGSGIFRWTVSEAGVLTDGEMIPKPAAIDKLVEPCAVSLGKDGIYYVAGRRLGQYTLPLHKCAIDCDELITE